MDMELYFEGTVFLSLIFLTTNFAITQLSNVLRNDVIAQKTQVCLQERVIYKFNMFEDRGLFIVTPDFIIMWEKPFFSLHVSVLRVKRSSCLG